MCQFYWQSLKNDSNFQLTDAYTPKKKKDNDYGDMRILFIRWTIALSLLTVDKERGFNWRSLIHIILTAKFFSWTRTRGGFQEIGHAALMSENISRDWDKYLYNDYCDCCKCWYSSWLKCIMNHIHMKFSIRRGYLRSWLQVSRCWFGFVTICGVGRKYLWHNLLYFQFLFLFFLIRLLTLGKSVKGENVTPDF